ISTSSFSGKPGFLSSRRRADILQPHGPAMSNSLRQAAISAIVSAKHKLNHINFKDGHIKELFGQLVFSEPVQRERLPNPAFKALQKTIKQGRALDPAIADAVATAMKDWAIEKGATHFT